MNFKLVLKAYSTLRQLSDDESALLATLRGMSDTERELLVESLQPEKASGKKKRQAPLSPCADCDYSKGHNIHRFPHLTGYHEFKLAKSSGKSARASNMAATLGKNLAQQRQGSTNGKCDYVTRETENGKIVCGDYADSVIHDRNAGYSGYHEFVPPSAQAASGD